MDGEFNLESVLRELGFTVGLCDGVMQASGVSVEGLGWISMQLHRDFNYTGNREMCVLCSNVPHMDCLYMGFEPRSYEELVTLFRMIFPLSSISKLAQKKFSSLDVMHCFDDIDKYIIYKDDYYVPIIYKHDNAFHDNSVWVMYAKENVSSFSTRKVLFHVKAGTIERALGKFIALYNEHCVSRLIRSREWYGTQPYELDFRND